MYDAQGRILRQEVIAASLQSASQTASQNASQNASQSAPQVTTWHYSARQLLAIQAPGQSEYYSYDARGLPARRTVQIHRASSNSSEQASTTVGGTSLSSTSLTSHTRYLHDESGQLQASTLPDGSWLHHQRNGQGQVVGLIQSPVQTSWLRKLAPEQTIASGFQRDLVGLKSWQSGQSGGNAITSQWQRSQEGDLARIVHRANKPLSTNARIQAQQDKQANQTLLGHSTQDTIDRLLGIVISSAQAQSTAQGNNSAQPRQPGALDLAADPQALSDQRYLWSSGGL